MPHYRKPKNQKIYDKYTAGVKGKKICEFCQLNEGSDQVVKIHKHFKIIYNIFPYDSWDSHAVIDHLMIVPNTHTESLANLGDEAAIEFVKLVSEYESVGYDVYARSPHSTVKSVPHQHTHLIKTGGKSRRGVVYFKKPYISISF